MECGILKKEESLLTRSQRAATHERPVPKEGAKIYIHATGLKDALKRD